uniref:Uncharacterized protein n=1 Tax=Kalanchoe fedtschenkoi TaxID=63787 RepID=A0A7N0VCE5_KALFE
MARYFMDGQPPAYTPVFPVISTAPSTEPELSHHLPSLSLTSEFVADSVMNENRRDPAVDDKSLSSHTPIEVCEAHASAPIVLVRPPAHTSPDREAAEDYKYRPDWNTLCDDSAPDISAIALSELKVPPFALPSHEGAPDVDINPSPLVSHRMANLGLLGLNSGPLSPIRPTFCEKNQWCSVILKAHSNLIPKKHKRFRSFVGLNLSKQKLSHIIPQVSSQVLSRKSQTLTQGLESLPDSNIRNRNRICLKEAEEVVALAKRAGLVCVGGEANIINHIADLESEDGLPEKINQLEISLAQN